MGIQNMLGAAENAMPADNRFPELGNGVYAIRPKIHHWKENSGIGTFIAEWEILESAPSGEGLPGFPASEVGAVRIFKIWGFKNTERHAGAVGKLKSYLGAALAHKGWSARGDHDFMQAAARFTEQAEHPKVIAMLADSVVRCNVKVCAPVNAGGKEWRLVSFL